MCFKCKDKIHVKFKFAKDHIIIDVKDVGVYPEEMDFSELNCAEHPSQSAVMFCTPCDRLVCTSCISKFHNGHSFIEISEGYNIKMKIIKSDHNKANEKMNELTKRKRELSHVHIKDCAKYNELINNIEVKKKRFKN